MIIGKIAFRVCTTLTCGSLFLLAASGCETEAGEGAKDSGGPSADAAGAYPDAAPVADGGQPPEDAGPSVDATPCTTDDAGPEADAGEPAVTLDPGERAILATLGPLPSVPKDTTNRVADSAAAAALGQRLFFDKAFSGPLKVDSDLGTTGQSGRVSCASCHAGPTLDDDRSTPDNVSLGTDFHTRNAPALVNASFYRWTNWGGRFSAQWELPLAVVENPIIMNGNRLQLAHRITDKYGADYAAVFGAVPVELADATRFPASGKPKPAATAANPAPPDGPWEGMAAADRTIVNTILVNYSKAVTAYMRLLVSRDAPLDKWIAGSAELDGAALRGAKLFVGKARCVSCHNGPQLSDGEFHNLGVPQSGPHVPASDDGRFKDVPALLASPFNSAGAFSDDPATGRLLGLTNPMPEGARGAFRTPSLRGVALSAPYMHAGQLATLADVIEFYDDGGATPVAGTKDPRIAPLGLSDGERADLEAFLTSLTGEPVAPALLVDTAATGP